MRIRVLLPFLRQGLERGEKVLYIMDAHTAKFREITKNPSGKQLQTCA
jgi:hypothetical protein